MILTKMDGDTRGGAALSIKAVTGKPILYVGMGEKLSDLEQFYPQRMASRILGIDVYKRQICNNDSIIRCFLLSHSS